MRHFSIQKGFTFIDILVGIALMLIVFLGIFGAYQLGLKVVSQSQNKITATAIANQKMEMIRNLPYESIGVKGGFPDGVLETPTAAIRNNIEYKIEARVDYVVDAADGISLPEDECPNDYKRAEVKVSWGGRFGGMVNFSTDVAPKNLSQECAEAGGILSVSVFDAYGIMVPAPLIEIKDPVNNQTIKTATPSGGKHYFSLSPSTYKIVVSKDGFSGERTYGIEEVATPANPHSIVLEGQLTGISFSIDKLSAFSVDTLSLWGESSFSDSFLDTSKISESSNIAISGGAAELLKTDEKYQSPGYLTSITIAPENLIDWQELSFSDFEPTDTQAIYQILYFNGANWVLVSNADLPGNSAGFEESPVDLSGLNPATYSQLRVKGGLSTIDPNFSPVLYHWQVFWKTTESLPIANVTFNLRGAKVIGTDKNESPIYKYSQEHTSSSQGHVDISGLEWDGYTISVDLATNLNLVKTDPPIQPIELAPDTTVSFRLYLKAENSLLLTAQNVETLEPIFAATVRLYSQSLGYDTTQYTNEFGQTYFIPLQPATYNLEVQGPGYSTISTTVSVSGNSTKTIQLEQVE